MNWQGLHQHFNQAFDFFGRISVSDSPDQIGVSVHPLIKLSTCLVLKTIDNSETNRLVVLLPNRLQFARWIATFAVLEVMRKDHRKNFASEMRFSRGQKLLLMNNCVVEFEKEEFSPAVNRRVMWVRCRDGRWAIPLDRKLEFQPTTTKRPLSSLERIKAAYCAAEILNNPIDNILEIRTMGNRSLFRENLILVSKIGETVRSIQGHYINHSKIIDLFQWGRLDVNGNVTVLTSGQRAAEPSCLIASDLFSTAEYVANDLQRTKGIIVDGVTSCLRDIQCLDDDLLGRGIPVIVIADFFDTESLPHLEEREFKVWQWNSDNISQSKSIVRPGGKSPFSPLNRSLTNYVDQRVISEPCEHPRLTEIAYNTLRLEQAVAASEDDQLQRLYSWLIKLVNDLSRTIWFPDQTWKMDFCQQIQRLQGDFASQRPWLAKDIVQAIDTILKGWIALGKSPFPDTNHKVNRLHCLIGNLSPSDLVAIIVSTEDDAADARQYWQEVVSNHLLSQLHFLAASDLQQVGEALPLTWIVICGWLNRKKMYPLLHSYLAPRITALLYPFEARWFRSAQKRWRKHNTYQIRGSDFSDILKLPKNRLSFADFDPQEADSLSEESDFDIVDFELKLERYRYSRFAATGGTRGEVAKAGTVVFTQNRFAFITETHRLLVITDLIRGKAPRGSIPRKDINQLQVGDYVLFRESDKDIIREIADAMLIEKGLSHLREVAGTWKKALQAEFEACDRRIDLLGEILARAGCKRHKLTIRNWLFDDDTIGPREGRKDLQRIARATTSSSLLETLAEVEEAIRIVRGAHLQASGYITRKLLSDLPEILDSEQGPDSEARRSVVLDLDDFGQIMILRVEEIDKEWKEYETRWVNRLLTREDD